MNAPETRPSGSPLLHPVDRGIARSEAASQLNYEDVIGLLQRGKDAETQALQWKTRALKAEDLLKTKEDQQGSLRTALQSAKAAEAAALAELDAVKKSVKHTLDVLMHISSVHENGSAAYAVRHARVSANRGSAALLRHFVFGINGPE